MITDLEKRLITATLNSQCQFSEERLRNKTAIQIIAQQAPSVFLYPTCDVC